jgi:electron transfer flavoprotein alpha/beta subunit
LGLNGSPTWVTKIFTPPQSNKGKLFSGEKTEAVAALIAELRQAGIEPDINRRILENAGN